MITLLTVIFASAAVAISAIHIRQARHDLADAAIELGLMLAERDALTSVADAHSEAAALLARIVRAKRPRDEATMSRRLIDLLDEAAALLRETLPAGPEAAEPIPYLPVTSTASWYSAPFSPAPYAYGPATTDTTAGAE